MKNELAIHDPLGNQVFVPGSFLEEQPNLPEDQIASAIERPAMHLVAKDNAERYYFRAVDWHQTVLITTKQNGGRWEVISISVNPSQEVLSTLLKNSNQIS